MKNYLRRNHAAIILILVGLFLVFGPSQFLESFKLGLGPEFVMKIFGKLLYLGVALACTQFVVAKFFPTIDEFCSRKNLEKESSFNFLFNDNPTDPRLWLSVFAHAVSFVGVCLVLALAF